MGWNGGQGGWNDATGDSYPDWVEVSFSGAKTIDEVDVFTVQDAITSPSTPTAGMTFALYGVTAYDVQYWTGTAWATVPNGSVTGNDKVWRKLSFPAVTTAKVRVLINGALASYSRLVEVEAWGGEGAAAGAGTDIRWVVSDQLGTPRMVADQTGSLADVSRHDYLPFGEELSANVGGRTAAQGYGAGDNVGQQFTGYERDEETKLDYAQARFYANVQGRFNSVDPENVGALLHAPQSWNGYAYVQNNPLNFIDPSGLSAAQSSDCSAEFSYEQCGGDAGFWGRGGFGDDEAMYYDLRGMPASTRAGLLRYEYGINNAVYGGGDGNSVVAYFDIYYWLYEDGSLETDFHLDGGTTGGYNPAYELAKEVNRRPIRSTFGVLYGGSVVAGATGGLGLHAVGGLGSGLTTLSSGATEVATETAMAATVHGAEQLAVRGFTEAEVALTRTGTQFLQRDGASVFLKEIAPGRYNVLVQGSRGVVTALKNIRWGAVSRLAANYGWYSPL